MGSKRSARKKSARARKFTARRFADEAAYLTGQLAASARHLLQVALCVASIVYVVSGDGHDALAALVSAVLR